MRTLVLLAPLALAACDTAIGTEITRDMAKSVVNDVVTARAPGVPIEPVSDCIIDNASGSEIIQIGSDAVTGTASADTVNTVIAIAGREGTITCFIEDAGPIVVGQLALALS